MKRCRHMNVSLLEFGDSYTSHMFEYGAISHFSDIGNYSGKIKVECHECGYCRVFGAHTKRPKWVENLLKLVTEYEN